MFYVEILEDFTVDNKKYQAGIYEFEKFVPHQYSCNAKQMWYETDCGNVWYAKPQLRTEPIDWEEFFWIKLRAKKMS